MPYLARHARVVVYDPRGNGRSDRPPGPAAYDDAELVADAVAVLDAVGVDAAVVVGLSLGARVLLAAGGRASGAVRGAVFVGAAVGAPRPAGPGVAAFEAARESYDGWARGTPTTGARTNAGFAEFFFGEVFPEPHSTRQVEEAVSWAMETDAETLVATQSPARRVLGPAEARAAAARVRCPALVIHGDDDRIAPLSDGRALGRGARLPARIVVGRRATASRPGTRSGSTRGCAGSWRR